MKLRNTLLSLLSGAPLCSAAALAAAEAQAAATSSSSSPASSTNPLVHVRPSADPGLVWAKRNHESMTTAELDDFSAERDSSALDPSPHVRPRDDLQTFELHYCSGTLKAQGVCGGPCSTTNGTNGAPMCVSAPSTKCVATQGGLVFDVCLEAGCQRCTASEDLKGSEVDGYWFYDLGALAGVVSLKVAA